MSNGKLFQSGTIAPFFPGLIIAIISVLLTVLLSPIVERIYRSSDANASAIQAFDTDVKYLLNDARTGNEVDFVSRAREFKKKMDADQFPAQYSGQAAMADKNGDIAALAYNVNRAFGYYLSNCVDTRAIFNQDQLKSDCRIFLHEEVSSVLETLSERLHTDQLYAK